MLEVYRTPVSAVGALRACWWSSSGVHLGELKEKGRLLFLERLLGIPLGPGTRRTRRGSTLGFSWDYSSHSGISVTKMVLASPVEAQK